MHYRLMNEYSVVWPFWPDDGPAAEGKPALPSHIEEAVRGWTAESNRSYSPEHGWPDPTTARQHEEQGHRLHAIIEKLLPPEDSVSFEYWETAQRGGPKRRGRSA